MAQPHTFKDVNIPQDSSAQQFLALSGKTPLPAIALEPWQYRLTAGPHPGGERVGEYWLSSAPDLPVTKVVDADGTPAGILLGFAIDLTRAQAVTGVWQTPEGADLSTDLGVAISLSSLGGRFLWVCLGPQFSRIYPDCATQISCVWDRESQSVGATSLSILDDAAYAARFDHAQFATLSLDTAGWFPAGLTAHSGVRRLLPNHYLDLETWTAHRFDAALALSGKTTTDEIVDEIIATVSTQVAALIDQPKSPVLALTGGYDTRVILACVRQWTNDLGFVTIDSGESNANDVALAKQIAQQMKLRHRVLPLQHATRAGQEQYLRRCGHCCADTNLRDHPTTRPLAQDHVFVGGFGGDVGRATLFYDDDSLNTPVTPALLLGRLGLVGTEKASRYLGWWAGPLKNEKTDRILDLAYLENQLGPWAMAQYCGDPVLQRFAPLLTYRTVLLMQALPLKWKQSNALSRAIISRVWPELLDLPFNSLGRRRGFADFRQAIWRGHQHLHSQDIARRA